MALPILVTRRLNPGTHFQINIVQLQTLTPSANEFCPVILHKFIYFVPIFLSLFLISLLTLGSSKKLDIKLETFCQTMCDDWLLFQYCKRRWKRGPPYMYMKFRANDSVKMLGGIWFTLRVSMIHPGIFPASSALVVETCPTAPLLKASPPRMLCAIECLG